jgi:hypothetical protein
VDGWGIEPLLSNLSPNRLPPIKKEPIQIIIGSFVYYIFFMYLYNHNDTIIHIMFVPTLTMSFRSLFN